MKYTIFGDEEQLLKFINAKINCIYCSHGCRFLDFVTSENDIFTFQLSWENDSDYHLIRLRKTKEIPNGSKDVPFNVVKDFYESCGKVIENNLIQHTYIKFT